MLCGGIFSTVFGHRALDGWRGRDSHAPSLGGMHSTPGSVSGTEGGGCHTERRLRLFMIFIEAIDAIEAVVFMAVYKFCAKMQRFLISFPRFRKKFVVMKE